MSIQYPRHHAITQSHPSAEVARQKRRDEMREKFLELAGHIFWGVIAAIVVVIVGYVAYGLLSSIDLTAWAVPPECRPYPDC